MNFKPRMGFPILLIALGLVGYFAYNGDANISGFEIKNLALISLALGVLWFLVELATSFGGARKASSRTVTDDGRGRPVETYHEEDVR